MSRNLCNLFVREYISEQFLRIGTVISDPILRS